VPPLPSGLLESELFGHERSLYRGPGADHRRFELAHQGTLLLDEIGNLPLDLQPKLLRCCRSKRLSGWQHTRPGAFDVRLVAATNRELAQMVDAGRFAPISTTGCTSFPSRLPPLRQRSEDIPLLVRHFVRHMRAAG